MLVHLLHWQIFTFKLVLITGPSLQSAESVDTWVDVMYNSSKVFATEMAGQITLNTRDSCRVTPQDRMN